MAGKCKVLRHVDEYQCHKCGIAWSVGDVKPECKRQSAESEEVARKALANLKQLLQE